jgi:hypothetical protein
MNKLPLLKYFLIWQFGASMGLFVLNLAVYGTVGEPTAIGLALVYSIYFGRFLATSFLIFFPPLMYRLFMLLRGKTYSRKSDLNWLILGVVLAIFSINSTIANL